MTLLGVVVGTLLIVVMLVDTFEVMLLPRRVAHSYRLVRVFYRSAWSVWRRLARLFPAGRRRNGFLGAFGPLSVFGLMVVWATGLIYGFAILNWSLDSPVSSTRPADDGFSRYLYMSGTTFFTLGYGDVVPTGAFGRASSVAEAGIGFGFLAVVISYLPVLYQAFSRREITISLLDARAGSPPSAGELLRRLAESRNLAAAGTQFVEWERWAAELLESHLSFPVLSYYRSQHDNQSWVAALTTILDSSALVIAAADGVNVHQVRLTFAMARHAAVDLGLIFRTPPRPPEPDRLPAAELARLQESLRRSGLEMREGPPVVQALTELRGLYEPFVNALAAHFQFELPSFQPLKPPVDNWQTSAWMQRSPDLAALPTGNVEADHFG